eukprot:1740682-Pyramimonas_sp.AAC.1
MAMKSGKLRAIRHVIMGGVVFHGRSRARAGGARRPRPRGPRFPRTPARRGRSRGSPRLGNDRPDEPDDPRRRRL